MNKQIEDMAKDLQETHDYEGCEAWHCGGCEYEKYGKGYFCSSIKQAEKMTVKGYRKASDVVMEIFEEIEQEIELALESNYKVMRDAIDDNDALVHYVRSKIDCLRGIYDFLSELRKKYEREGADGA